MPSPPGSVDGRVAEPGRPPLPREDGRDMGAACSPAARPLSRGQELPGPKNRAFCRPLPTEALLGAYRLATESPWGC